MADNTVFNFPSDGVDPRAKDAKWILQYAKAAWHTTNGFMPDGYLFKGNTRFNEIKTYALGKQIINKYKKLQTGSEQTDASWLTTDWTPVSPLVKYRNIIVSKILQKKFEINAFAVDPLAKSEEDEYYNKMKVKIMMREMAEKMGSDLAESPALMPNPDEPQDMEQLQIDMQFGYKHVMSMEAEEAIQLILEQNDSEEKRKRVIEDLVDFGISGYVPYIDENGKVKYREIEPSRLGLSYCTKPDFSDLKYFFEVVDVLVDDLVPYFTKDQIADICKKAANKYGNPQWSGNMVGRFWERFKVQVCQLRFLSYNDLVFKDEIDSRGNESFGRTHYNNKQFIQGEKTLADEYNEPLRDSEEQGNFGEATPKYISATRKVVYKASWIVGTDYMYDYGLSENMIRKQSSWWDTSLDIVLYAWNFHEMQFTGLTELLIPIEDKYCNTWYRLQNLTNKLVPYLINIDLNVLENTSFGKGGENWKPEDVLEFIFNNFVVPYRSNDLLSSNPNYKPMSIEASGQLAAFSLLYEDLMNCERMMQSISGLNDATDGSTVNSKNLTSTNQAMFESTNNAIYLIEQADKRLMTKLSDLIMCKIQIAVKLGKTEGYIRALGTETVKFLEINPDLSLYEFGIFLRDMPSQEERQQLLAELNLKDSQGLISPEDKILVMSCTNLKQAAALLAYKVKKRREEQAAEQQQLVALQSQQQTEGALMIEQAKQQTIMLQAELDMRKIQMEKMWEFQIEIEKKKFDLEGEMYQSDGRQVANEIQAHAKIISSQVAAEASIIKEKMKPKPTKKIK
jgi:hypothetical protein